MSKSLSITVYPSALGAEFLSVSDAMRQILDIVDALEKSEAVSTTERKVVWRLVEAHTNSPPLTITAEAFPVNPTVSIGLIADQLASTFAAGIQCLLEGQSPEWIGHDVASPLKRAFQRNMNGVGRTRIELEEGRAIDVVPSTAQAAVIALDRIELNSRADLPDLRHTEYGDIETEVCGITRWNDKPALVVVERLSREKVTCVLSAELAEKLGPSHRWHEAWDGQRLLVTGAMHYGSDGGLKRIDAIAAEDMPWTSVSIADLKGVDILGGLSVSEHLSKLRGRDFG
ncbi:hypothetical protein [Prosthecodimorpha hirschii]|uniref:hypothetical protein n=1 Tax=Prosthecodimorpha hirschii TaxID=665126 RepID=UPI001127A03F|nr:hypothetical protein [Prosthecomicrobium hirschii]